MSTLSFKPFIKFSSHFSVSLIFAEAASLHILNTMILFIKPTFLSLFLIKWGINPAPAPLRLSFSERSGLQSHPKFPERVALAANKDRQEVKVDAG